MPRKLGARENEKKKVETKNTYNSTSPRVLFVAQQARFSLDVIKHPKLSMPYQCWGPELLHKKHGSPAREVVAIASSQTGILRWNYQPFSSGENHTATELQLFISRHPHSEEIRFRGKRSCVPENAGDNIACVLSWQSGPELS